MDKKFARYIRFILAGIANTGVDYAVFNFLLLLDDSTIGKSEYAAFKGISFIAAVITSYYLNKYWVFARKNAQKTEGLNKERLRFLLISVTGFLLNISVSSAAFRILTVSSPLDSRVAANMGAICGTLLVLAWNFIGYKTFVFRERPE
ncbi:MAG TPA: GtrA family protein [Candidatus Paceibacterota bacterium]|nr:GtrA family protein [Candidatus Paceibacterota bacterium]